jgi:hypothetical protein
MENKKCLKPPTSNICICIYKPKILKIPKYVKKNMNSSPVPKRHDPAVFLEESDVSGDIHGFCQELWWVLPGVLWGPIYGDVHRKKYDMGIHFWCIFG